MAVVQGDHTNGYRGGTVAWWEHEAAWLDYARRYRNRQDAEAIHRRGGFSYAELTDHLGHEPTTWVPRSRVDSGGSDA